QSGSFMTARRGTVDLAELLEHRSQLVGGNADACVLYVEDYVIVLAHDVDQHMTPLRELDGIAGEIGQDLADTPDIADDPVRQVGIDTHNQLKILLGDARRNQRRDVLHGFTQVERCRIELDMAGVYLREVEDVVDDGQQRIAGLDD